MSELGENFERGKGKNRVEEWTDPADPKQEGNWFLINRIEVLVDKGVLARTEIDEKGKTKKPKGNWQRSLRYGKYRYWERKSDKVQEPGKNREISRADWLLRELDESYVGSALRNAEKGDLAGVEEALAGRSEDEFLTSEQKDGILDLALRQFLKRTTRADDELMQKFHEREDLNDWDKKTLQRVRDSAEIPQLFIRGRLPLLAPESARGIIRHAYDVFEQKL